MAIASSGSNYLVAWQDQRNGLGANDIYAARMGMSGALMDPSGLAIAAGATEFTQVTVAYGAGNYLLAWHQGDNDSLRALRLAPTGALVDPALGFEIANNLGTAYSEPFAIFDGTNYQVAFVKPTGIYGTRISTSGAVLDANGFTISENISPLSGRESDGPKIACHSGSCFAAWTDRRSTATPPQDIYGARYQKDGTVLDVAGIAVSTAADAQLYPFALTDGNDFFVLWETEAWGGSDIYFNRLALP